MTADDPALRLRQVADLLARRRFAEARSAIEPLARAMPDIAKVQHLLGIAAMRLGDGPAAGRALAAAQQAAPRDAEIAADRARLLLALGRAAEALAATDTIAAAGDAPDPLLVERARALKALGRIDEAVAERARIVARNPADARAQHNLAAAAGDAGDAERAETAARAAIAAGGDAPETWLVLARALQALGRFDEAEAAFGAAIHRRPDYVDARRDLAQLHWMRSGDAQAALAMLEVPAVQGASAARLRAIAARLLADAGDPRAGYARLLHRPVTGDAMLEMTAAHLAARFDPARAVAHAARAAALAPANDRAVRCLVEALLAAGDPRQAMARIAPLRTALPLDQELIALEWTGWRLTGDARADALYDYAAFVRAAPIAPPPGWSRLDDYLRDLAAGLGDLHRLRTHPLDQSLRHGTQTGADLRRSRHPAIAAFRDAIAPAVADYLDRLGTGPDVLRRRNAGRAAPGGMWSVRLHPGGFHVDHIHPHGWLSSACHIAVPADDGMRGGWLKFGQPGIATSPALGPEHWVPARAGQITLFPSYMWHGTAPFGGNESRLSIAFDLMPA
ncbi:putative 2OG-Fe(II) oxygenase [Sphingomonas silueang]|uniref:putative 2OG-Fe(II) oxygenase n=1 Tax=Sphingomonas silueang TaxID=3156617 RepID=UPI0032B3D6B5